MTKERRCDLRSQARRKIMIIVSNVHYPPESTREVAKRYLTAPALPDYITKKGPYVSSSTEKGIHSLTYYEIENHRLSEALLAIG